MLKTSGVRTTGFIAVATVVLIAVAVIWTRHGDVSPPPESSIRTSAIPAPAASIAVADQTLGDAPGRPRGLNAPNEVDHALLKLLERALEEWHVPGAAMAVVKDRTAFVGGAGFREIGGAAVDGSTLFAIASTTKGFTSAVIGRLAESGSLSFHDPLSRHSKEIQFYDPQMTESASFVDALSQRTGLERSDGIWHGSKRTRHEVLQMLPTLRLRPRAESNYSYNNIVYLAAATAAEQSSRESWDEAVKRHIFDPLGMTHSTTRSAAILSASNAARGYEQIDGALVAVPYIDVDNCGPASSIVSNAEDMAKWLAMWLGGGTFQGAEILKSSTVAELWAPRIVIPEKENIARMIPNKTKIESALSWLVHDYRGRAVVSQPGNINGMRTYVAMIPELKLGVVVMANRALSPLPIAVAFDVFDHYLGGDATGRSERIAAMKALEQQHEGRSRAIRLYDEAMRLNDARQTMQARQLLDQAIALDPERVDLYVGRSKVLLSDARYAEAIADASRALELDSTSAFAANNRAIAKMRLSDFSGAIADYELSLRLDPRSADVHANLARARMLNRDFDGATKAASDALAINPQHAVALAVRGIVRIAAGDDVAGRADIEESIRLRPDLRRAIEQDLRKLRP